MNLSAAWSTFLDVAVMAVASNRRVGGSERSQPSAWSSKLGIASSMSVFDVEMDVDVDGRLEEDS